VLALLALLVVDLATVLFAVDTRPGLEHSPRPWSRPGTRPTVRTGPGTGPAAGSATGRARLGP
jgi:hypothetical protein